MSAALKLREYPKPPELRKVRDYKNHRPNPKGVLLLSIAFFVGFLMLSYMELESKSKSESVQNEQAENETLEDFVKRAIKEKKAKKDGFVLGNVTTQQAKAIKEATGINVSGFKWELDNFAVRHIYKRHPETKLNDFVKIYKTLNTFDKLIIAKNQKKSVVEIAIIKKYEIKESFLFVEIRKKALSITTMYGVKIKKHK